MKQKLALIYLPFLLLGLGFIFAYTVFHWLILTQFDSLPIKDMILEIILPIGIFSVLTFIYLRPKIKLLTIKRKKKTNQYPFFYLIAAIIVIAIPTLLLQNYLVKAAGKLTELASISSISQHPSTKYYSLEKSYIAKQQFAVHPSFEVKMSSGHHEEIVATLYIAIPIYDSLAASAGEAPAWLGEKYTTKIDSWLSDTEKERKFEAFVEKSQTDFNAKNLQKFQYLERLGRSTHLDGYREAIKTSPRYIQSNDTVFIAHDATFEARTENLLKMVFLFYIGGMMLWLAMLWYAAIDEVKLKELNAPINKEESALAHYLKFLKPQGDFFITPILLNANMIVALLFFFSTGTGLISYKTADLIQWGANFGPSIEEGEYWRLFTSLFLHGGLPHLVANMFSLALIGAVLEPAIGRLKFAFVFLSTGVLASLASFYWSGGVSVGASGAILGLYGMYLALFYGNMRDGWKELQWDPLAAVPLVALVAGFILPGVDNAAHIGGLLSGSLMGFLMAKRDERDLRDRGV